MEQNDRSESPKHPPRTWIAAVFEELEEPLVAFVARRVSSPETARDIVQEAFVRLCQQAWPAIQENSRAWLYKTCRNRAIDIARKESRMNTVHSGEELETLQDRRARAADESVLHGEQLQEVRAQMQKLPSRQQELLRLRLQEGLSYKQIAEITGLTVSNVGYLLHQSVNMLRGKLQPR